MTVVIPAKDEADYIGETLAALAAQTLAPAEVIVVDDASTDGTGDIARAAGATVLRCETPSGTKARAQSRALPLVKTPLVAIIDADTRLEPDALAQIVADFADPRVSAACGQVLPVHARTLWERGRLIEYLLGQWLHKGAQRQCGVLLVANGCFSVFRTERLRELGGFEPVTMAEDMDLTWRLLLDGDRVLFEPRARCRVVDPEDRSTYFAQVDRWYRGFFQNVLLHARSLWRRPGLAIFALGYLASSTFLLAMWAGLLSAALAGEPAALGVLIADLIFVTAASTIVGARCGVGRRALASVPAFYLLRGINAVLVLRAMWLECVLRRPLEVWHKGHGGSPESQPRTVLP